MATLTWRDVAPPSFAGVNQAYQGAGATLDRALSGLSDGLKQFATDRQAGVDNSLLARSLQIQDPDKMRAALASGELLQGVDLTKVNPKVLEALNTRVGTLLNQASTQQSIASSKTSQAATQQNIDFGAQDQTRKIGQLAIEDAARPQLARELGITGPAANLSTDALQKLAGTRSSLIGDRLNQQGQAISNDGNSFNNSVRKRDDAAGQGAISNAAQLVSEYGTTDGYRSGIEGMSFKSPAEKMATIAYLEKTTGQPIYTPLDAPVTGTASRAPSGSSSGGSGGGSAKGGKGGYTPPKTYEFQSDDARKAGQEIDRRNAQNNSVGVLADVERTIGDNRPSIDIAGEIALKIPGADPAKINGILVKAMSKHPGMLASEAGAAFERSTDVSRWYDGSNTTVGTGAGIDDTTFNDNLTKMANGRVDYMSADNQSTRASRKVLENADKALANAKADLLALQRRSESQGGKIQTFDAEDRVQRAQDRLDELLQKQKDTPSQQPNYEPVKPVNTDAKGLQRLFEAGRTRRGGN